MSCEVRAIAGAMKNTQDNAKPNTLFSLFSLSVVSTFHHALSDEIRCGDCDIGDSFFALLLLGQGLAFIVDEGLGDGGDPAVLDRLF